MSVPQFINQMETKGWELISSSIIDGGNYTKTYKYLFKRVIMPCFEDLARYSNKHPKLYLTNILGFELPPFY